MSRWDSDFSRVWLTTSLTKTWSRDLLFISFTHSMASCSQGGREKGRERGGEGEWGEGEGEGEMRNEHNMHMIACTCIASLTHVSTCTLYLIIFVVREFVNDGQCFTADCVFIETWCSTRGRGCRLGGWGWVWLRSIGRSLTLDSLREKRRKGERN